MAKVLRAQEIEAEVEEDSGYFYQRLGLYVAKVHDLLGAATKGEEDQELPPANADKVCVCTLPVAAASVALSCDEELLAAWDYRKISIWSLCALLSVQDTCPLTDWQVPGGAAVKQLVWRAAQGPGTVPEAAVVTVNGQLLRGSLGGPLQPLPGVAEGQVSCVAWSADGSLLALASANCVTVQHLASGRHFRTEFESRDAKDADGKVTVDTLSWSGPQSLLVSANVHPVEDPDAEMDIAPLAVVRWAAWDVHAGTDPVDLQLVEFIAPAINPDAAPRDSGPYTHVAQVPAWGALVVAHSKASDDHIRLYELGAGAEAKAVDVTEDWSAIRIPTAMDYNDNYVTGLGVDFTSTDVEVMPPDPQASARAPSPVLLVATSDGALRLFTFGHMTKPTKGIVAPVLEFSGAIPPMASGEQDVQSKVTKQEAENAAATVPLPSDDDEEEEEDEADNEKDGGKGPAADAPLSRRLKAQASQAAAIALPPSSDEDEQSSDEAGAEFSGSSSISAARAARAALPSDESDLEDDADSRLTQSDRPSISRLHISEQAEDGDAAESQAPLGLMTGRKLDFGSDDAAETKPSKKALPPPGLGSTSQTQQAPSLFGAPSLSAASTSAAPFAGFSFDSAPAVSASSAGAFAFPRQAASSAAASSGAAAENVPSIEIGSNLGIFGSTATGLGAASTAPFQNLAATLPDAQGSQEWPSRPPQSAQQRAIAKAREAQAAKETAAAAASPPPQSLPCAAPQRPARSAVSERSAVPASDAGLPARRASQQERAVTPAPQKPPKPEARLKGESKELAAMEEDFLKTLAETRELEHAFAAAMAKSEGGKSSGPGTRLGFHALQERIDALKRSVTDILASLATERRRFGEQHNGWREDRARAEALLYFNGKHGNSSSANGSVDDSMALDPALQELATSVDTQLQALQKQTFQLNECLKALEERASMRLSGAGAPSRASAQQLYNAVNAQTAVATAQLERLELLWQKLHDMGISGDDDGEMSGSIGPPAFPYISPLKASRPSSSTTDSPTTSSRRTWQQVRKSPLGRPKPRRPAPLSPLSSLAVPAESPWACESAGSLRRLLLEKVSIEGGGVRLTRMGGTEFPRLPQPSGQEPSDWNSPTKGVIASQQPPTVQAAKPGPLPSPFHSSAQVDDGPQQPTVSPSFGQSAGLMRAGSSAVALDSIQRQAAPRQGRDTAHRARQPLIPSGANDADAKRVLGRRESTASADSSGSTSNAVLRPKHARPGSTQDFPQGSAMGNLRPFQRPASGLGFTRAGSAALAPAEKADSSDSAAESTNKGPTHRIAAPHLLQATIPEEAAPSPAAAKMPPVPSRAAVAAAQAHGQAALQRASPSPAAKMPPVPGTAAMAAAQAHGQAALRTTAPAARTPPVPDKAAVAAAQAKGQAALQQSAQAPPAAKTPPVPSKAAVAAAQAQGQAALKKATAPAAKMPPVPSKAALAAAHAQGQAALQNSSPAAPSAPTTAAAAASSSPFANLSGTTGPAGSSAQPVFNFAKLSSGDAASPAAQQPTAFSFASAMSSPVSAAGTTTSSAFKDQAAPLFASVQPTATVSTPALSHASTAPAASQPLFGSFGMSASQPAASAPAPSISSGAPPASSSAASAAPPTGFTGFAQLTATASSPLTSTFGSQAPSPATAAFGTLSFGSSASQQASSAAALASGFGAGAFGGLGQSTPASSSAGSPFGKGLSFGTPALQPSPSSFGGFVQPSTASAGAAFASFGQSAPAFGQPQTPMSSAAPGSGTFSAGGFGQSSGFGQVPGSGFGQPPSLGAGFGQPAKPGFGQTASPGFGAPATPGFGAPATPGFGSPAAPSAQFGGATGSNAFGAAAAQGSGFGAFASMAGQPSAFGAAAQAGGGFAAAAQQGGGFSGFGGAAAFGAPSSPAASPSNSDMWQMRK